MIVMTLERLAARLTTTNEYACRRSSFNNAELMEQAQLSMSDAGARTIESIIKLAINTKSLWKHMTTEERRELLDELLSNRVLD